jgi:hypothetical protein
MPLKNFTKNCRRSAASCAGSNAVQAKHKRPS